MAAGTVRDWSQEAVQKYMNANGPDIAKAALRGDKIAQKVWNYYKIAYDASKMRRLRPGCAEDLNLRDALNDYVIRDLNIKERERLAGAIGHRIEEAEKPIFVGGTGIKQ